MLKHLEWKKDSKNTYKAILDLRGQKFSKITQGMHGDLSVDLFISIWMGDAC